MTSNLCSRVNNGSCLAGYAHTQCFQKSQVDILFTCFCDSKGIIHRELVRKGETITGKYYLGVMQYLWWIINRILGQNVKSQEAGTQCTIIPLLARPLQYVDSLSVCGTNKQTKKKPCIIQHPLYSSDLSLCNYHLFPKLKITMKGTFYNDAAAMSVVMTRVNVAVSKTDQKPSMH